MLLFRRLLAVVTVLVFAECLMSSLNAAVIIGNLPGNDGSTISFASGSTLSIGFLTGSSDVRLGSVSFRLNAQNSSVAARLELRGDQSGAPAPTVLANLGSHSVASTGIENYEFNPGTETILLSSTTYWLTISTLASSVPLIVGASDNENTPPTALASYFGLRFFDGASFVNLDGDPVPTFQANGTLISSAVPEPSSWLFLFILTGLVPLFRKSPLEAFSFKHQL
jgi:hypothetical protein